VCTFEAEIKEIGSDPAARIDAPLASAWNSLGYVHFWTHNANSLCYLSLYE